MMAPSWRQGESPSPTTFHTRGSSVLVLRLESPPNLVVRPISGSVSLARWWGGGGNQIFSGG